MNIIDSSLKAINQALSIKESKFKTFIRWLLCSKETRLTKIAKIFNDSIANLESVSAKDKDIAFLKTGQKIEDLMKNFKSKAAKNQLNQLSHNIISLKYRLGKENGGLDRIGVYDHRIFQNLIKISFNWKKSQWIFKDKDITASESEKLKEITHYPEFAQLLENDENLQRKFFNWIFKRKNSPRIFIEFPETVQKLRKVFLHSRIGQYEGRHLRIEINEGKKELQLNVQGKWFNILDPNQKIIFKNGLIKTVDEIFKNCAKRVAACSDYEMFEDGLNNWNASEYGFRNNQGGIDQIKFIKEEWYEEMPVEQILTKEQVKEKYGKIPNNNEWLVSIVSTRSRPTLLPYGTHSYYKIGKAREDGNVRFYTFGLVTHPDYYPANSKQTKQVSAKPLPGRVNCPDENEYFSHREKHEFAVIANKIEGTNLMDSIKKDIMRGFNNNGRLIYHYFIRHCAYWTVNKAHKHLNQKVPKDIYEMPFYSIEFPGIGGKIFRVFKKMPACIRNGILKIYFWCLGGSKKMSMTKETSKKQRVFCLLDTPPWKNGTISLPAKIFVNQVQS